MRILFLSSVFPRPGDPTCGIYCAHMCEALSREHEVRVVSPRSWLECLRGDWREPVWPAGHSLRKSLGAIEYPRFYYPPGVLANARGWWMWRSIKRRVTRVLDEFRPDCVLSYWAHPDGEAAVRAARAAGVPCAVIVGGSDVLLLGRDPRRGRAVVRALTAADAVIAVSDDLRDKTISLGVPGAKVYVVRQGIDTERFCPGDQAEARRRVGVQSENSVLLWVGRMDPVKGLEVLIQAASVLRDRHTDFRLYLVGNGPQRKVVEAALERLALTDCVVLLGSSPQDELPDWYRAADLTVLSSHSEGIPNVLRESLACGTPYVSTRVGGIAELCPDPALRLVPPNNAVALADAIAASLAERAGGVPPDFHAESWDVAAASLAKILEQLWERPADARLALSSPTGKGLAGGAKATTNGSTEARA